MKKMVLILLLVTIVTQAQWILDTNGLGYATIKSLAYSGNTIFAGSGGGTGIYLSTNNGTNWIQTSLNNRTVSSIATTGNFVFAGTAGTGVYKSTNNGTTWSQTTLNNREVWSLLISGNNILAGTTNYGIDLSTNNGTNWIQTSYNSGWIYSLVKNGNTIFAGGWSGVYKSTDNGMNWTQTSLNNRIVEVLAVSGNNIFAGTNNYGVYLSTDNGMNWSQSGLNNRSVFSLAVNGKYVFAATYNYGVYVSSDNGINWIQRNEGLSTGPFFMSLCIMNNYIFAGTGNSGHGLYRRLLSELTGIHPISTEIPNQFSLSQNYPNPFNPKTVISFQLAVNSFALLKVYDLIGREVETLVNEQLNAGTYEADFDGSNFASGIYYYTLSASPEGMDTQTPLSTTYTETRKMVLMK